MGSFSASTSGRARPASSPSTRTASTITTSSATTAARSKPSPTTSSSALCTRSRAGPATPSPAMTSCSGALAATAHPQADSEIARANPEPRAAAPGRDRDDAEQDRDRVDGRVVEAQHDQRDDHPRDTDEQEEPPGRQQASERALARGGDRGHEAS